MLDKIHKNLYLKIDYQKNKPRSGIEIPGVKFYLIGMLPVFIVYGNGKKEVAQLLARQELNTMFKDMRDIIGLNAKNENKLKNYRKEIKEICLIMEKEINNAVNEGRWRGTPIKEMAVIKV